MLGKELFRIGLFVVEKIGVKIRKTRLKYGKQRSRSTQMGGKGLATLIFRKFPTTKSPLDIAMPLEKPRVDSSDICSTSLFAFGPAKGNWELVDLTVCFDELTDMEYVFSQVRRIK